MFIAIQSEFIFFTLSKSLPRIQISLATISIILAIAAIIPQARESLGLMITPVHHGGNIICTFLFGSWLVWNAQERHNKTGQTTRLALAAALAFIAIASNKLFALNALTPGLLAAAITTLACGQAPVDRLGWKPTTKTIRTGSILAASAFSGLALTTLLNRQCSPKIVIDAPTTLVHVGKILNANPYVLIAVLLLIGLMLTAHKPLNLKTFPEARRKEESIKMTASQQQLLLGSSFLFFSILSPITYVWLFGENQLLQIRHILIIPAAAFITFSLTGSQLLNTFKASPFNTRPRLTDAGMITALASSILLITRAEGFKTLSLQDAYRSSILSRHEEAVALANKLNQRKLSHGLSDFWGITVAEISKLQHPESNQITIQPIRRKRGEPDLWGARQKPVSRCRRND